MKKCKYADKYKGLVAPKCNGGNPCDTCLSKYIETQALLHKMKMDSFFRDNEPNMNYPTSIRIVEVGERYSLEGRQPFGAWREIGVTRIYPPYISKTEAAVLFKTVADAMNYVRYWYGSKGIGKLKL